MSLVPRTIDSYVMVTSIVGVHHVGDVTGDGITTPLRQWFHNDPTPLTDPTWAYGWAADSALDRTAQDNIVRDVWLIIGGRVADHFNTRVGTPTPNTSAWGTPMDRIDGTEYCLSCERDNREGHYDNCLGVTA